MIGRPGLPEIILVLVIVIIVFGVGRLTKVGKELGTAIREFRKGLGENPEEAKPEDSPEKK